MLDVYCDLKLEILINLALLHSDFLKEKGGWVGESCEVAPQEDSCAERAVSGHIYGFAGKAKGGGIMVSLKYKTRFF